MQLWGKRLAAVGNRPSWYSPPSGCGFDSPTPESQDCSAPLRGYAHLRRRPGAAAPRAEKAPPPHSASDCSRLAASRPRAERVAPASPHRVHLALAVAAVAPGLAALVSLLAPWRPGPMAPQRRGPPRVPEGSSAAERRRANR